MIEDGPLKRPSKPTGNCDQQTYSVVLPRQTGIRMLQRVAETFLRMLLRVAQVTGTTYGKHQLGQSMKVQMLRSGTLIRKRCRSISQTSSFSKSNGILLII